MPSWKDIRNKLHSDGMTIPPTLSETKTMEVTEKKKEVISWKNLRDRINNKSVTTIKKRKKVEQNTSDEKETKTVDTINTDNEYNFDKNKSYLVINGKAREIGRKSKYLLDMLIIDKED